MNASLDRLSGWHNWCELFVKLAAKVNRTQSVKINSAQLREEVKAVVRSYLNDARQYLLSADVSTDLNTLDENLQSLYRLADGANRTAAYKSRVTAVRKVLPTLTPQLEMRAATTGAPPGPADPAETDRRDVG